mgnify:CR=1 FL=1
MAITRYQTTEYNRHARLASTVRDVYASGHAFAWTHETERAEMARRVYSTRDYAKLTPYYCGKIAGLRECLADQRYQRDLKWQLYLDGEPCTSAEISAKREAGDAGVWDRVEGAHVWAHKPECFYSTRDRVSSGKVQE